MERSSPNDMVLQGTAQPVQATVASGEAISHSSKKAHPQRQLLVHTLAIRYHTMFARLASFLWWPTQQQSYAACTGWPDLPFEPDPALLGPAVAALPT